MKPPDPSVIAAGKDVAELFIQGWISKELLEKLLGPTAAYVGDQAKALVEKCNFNVNAVMSRAVRKLGGRLDSPGQVNPRILRGVLQDAAFTEDEVASEYFGGVLASSRTDDGRDDRGVAFLALIRDLSTYQLRVHYLFYRAVRRMFQGQALLMGLPADRAKMRLFIPLETFVSEVGASEEQVGALLEHSVHGLARSGLIDQPFYFGREDYIRRAWSDVPGPGMLVVPSVYGVELFLWAHGLGDLAVRHFLDGSIEFERSDGQDLPATIVAVPRQEDIAILKRQIERAAADVDAHVAKMTEWLNDRGQLPAFPNDTREHIRYVVQELRDLPNDVGAYLLRCDLDAALDAPEDKTQRERIELFRSLYRNLEGLLRSPKGDNTA